MKVAYLLGSLNRGGTETLLLDVVKNSKKAEFPFVVIHRKEGVLKDEFYDSPVPLFQLRPRFPFSPFYLIKLRRLLKNKGITIVHAQQYLDCLYAKIACIGTPIKIVQTFHGFDGFEKPKRAIALSIRWADANIFVSQYQKNYYTTRYRLKNRNDFVVYNGINFDKVKDAQKKQEQAAKLRLGSVGNFVSVRDQLTTSRFLDLLNTEDIDFEFSFVGAPSKIEPWLYQECVDFCGEKGLEDKVHFLGSRDDVPELLTQWDAFIYSTDHDTFGIAVIEAIASGLPVFVNDWEVMREITEDGKLASIYKSKDEHDLLRIFMLFLQNKDSQFERLCENKKAVKNKYSIETHIANLTLVYKQTEITNKPDA